MSKVHSLPRAEKPAPATVTKNVVMTFKRSTKGTHVFESDAEDALCTQLYLRKAALGDTAPASITLTVAYTA